MAGAGHPNQTKTRTAIRSSDLLSIRFMKTGMKRILAERQRQITKEGWSADHDDRHDQQEMQRAAESYLLSAGMTRQGFKSFRPPDCWPWSKKWWKPKTEIRDLTRAGALWLAEIDRLKRLGETYQFPTILKNLDNRVKECARRIDELNA